MKSSYVIAVAVAAAVFAWIYSGQFGADEVAAQDGSEMAKAEERANKPEVLPRVRTQISVASDHQRVLLLFGRTEAARHVDVKVETAGRIIALPVRKGSIVKKGQVIARLAMEDRKARLAEAKALVNQYDIAYKAALKLSQKQYRSKVKLAESVAKLEMAKAGLKTINSDIARTVVRAPFAGILEQKLVEIGDYLKIGQAVAGIVDLDPILVVGELAERSVKLLQLDTEAVAHTLDGQVMIGKVSFISKVASPSTRTFRIEISVANPEGSIPAGMTAQMSLNLGAAKAHFISPAVLTLSSEGILGVKVLDQDGIVRFHTGAIVEDTPEGLWVEGLPERIELITIGQEFVRTGQKAIGTADPADSAVQQGAS